MSKYEKLDAAILNKIGGHPQRFVQIYTGSIVQECDRIAIESGNGTTESFRVCDRRLQALRKAGKIVSTSKGWIKSTGGQQ